MTDTATPPVTSALDVFRANPDTLDAATRTLALLRVITDEAKDREKTVKAWLTENTSPGMTYRDPSGLGRISRTAPQPQAKVSDATALGEWIADTYGPDTESVQARDEIDGKVVASACAGNPELAAKVAELVPSAKVRRYYMDGDVADKLARRYGRKDPTTGALEEGPLATDDGEVIPGIEVATKASSTVSFTPDKAALADARDALAGRRRELEL